MAAVCLVAGLIAVAGFWVATEARAPGTSPLAQLFTLAWSITYILASALMWRRSRFAPPLFAVATGFPAALLSFIFPRGELFFPSLIVTAVIALFGYRYLRRESQRLA